MTLDQLIADIQAIRATQLEQGKKLDKILSLQGDVIGPLIDAVLEIAPVIEDTKKNLANEAIKKSKQ